MNTFSESVVEILEKKDVNYYKNFLIKNGVRVYEINGDKIKDADSFFKQIIGILPQDPPLDPNGAMNLDAFVDSIWGGLDRLLDSRRVDKVAIVWNDINNIIEHDLNDLLKIIESFQDLSKSLSTTEYGLSKPISLSVYLFANKNQLSKIKAKMG